MSCEGKSYSDSELIYYVEPSHMAWLDFREEFAFNYILYRSKVMRYKGSSKDLRMAHIVCLKHINDRTVNDIEYAQCPRALTL